MATLALALFFAAAPAPAADVVTVVVDAAGAALVVGDERTPLSDDELRARAADDGALSLRLAPDATVPAARAALEAFVAAGRADAARAALTAALGAEPPPLCGDDVDKPCALVRVHALAHGVLLHGAVGATDLLRQCGPVGPKPLLSGRVRASIREYAGVTRNAAWDGVAGLLAEAWEGGGSEVCTTVLLERVDDDVTVGQWRALEDGARAAGYAGVTRPAWARAIVPSPPAPEVSPFAPPPAEEGAEERSSPPWCLGLCG